MEESYSAKGGGFRSIWILFIPLVGTTFSNYLFALLEKVFLSRISEKALESAVNGTYACQIFQVATIALVMMAQVTVARWHGARQHSKIGPEVWQFIWVSILSLAITVPISLFYGIWYFRGTEIETTVLPYFYLLTSLNFLFPLGASLSCFFLGQGKTRFVLFATLGDQLIKVSLSYLLIFGVGSWIQPLGILGGAIANLSSQGLLCLLFFFTFIRKKNRETYHSHKWKLDPSIFWDSIRPGVFRALNRAFAYASWGLIAHLMAARGGNFLLILSLGGSLTLFLPFLSDAISQSQTIVVSQLAGANQFPLFSKITRASLTLVCSCIALVGIPLVGFSSLTFNLLFPHISLDVSSIRNLLFGVWLWFASFTLVAIPMSFIFAFRDMKFHFYIGCIFWPIDYVLMYFFIEKLQIQPSLFWIALALVQMSHTIPVYVWRMIVLWKRAADKDKVTGSTNLNPV